ncbi:MULTISPECIES: acyltransferase [unclassified Lentimonas]|uniref:acyltransferase n=1 Tax=unclassified Lentimonas TaxID=2630993 RepID=UPI00138A394E|nr:MULTISPECIES: acyltransferase [unclassified Lentimonas]
MIIYDKVMWKVNSFLNARILKKNAAQTSNYMIYGRIFVKNKMGVLKIGSNFLCNSGPSYNPIGRGDRTRLSVDKGATLTIGKDVGISNSTIICATSVSIGNKVLIGGGCCLWDTDFHSIDPAIREEDFSAGSRMAPIIVEDNVFIGAGTIVLKGVSIGRNSVVGAGSVVAKSIPSNEVWAGAPARFIRAL